MRESMLAGNYSGMYGLERCPKFSLCVESATLGDFSCGSVALRLHLELVESLFCQRYPDVCLGLARALRGSFTLEVESSPGKNPSAVGAT